MPSVRDWAALRRPLRSCAIGALVLVLFFAALQFVNPRKNPNPVATWTLIFTLSVCLSSGVGLAVSATRRLWRSKRGAASVLPALFLVGALVALPGAASAAGAHWLKVAAWLLAALPLSAAFSAYLIVTGAGQTRPPTP